MYLKISLLLLLLAGTVYSYIEAIYIVAAIQLSFSFIFYYLVVFQTMAGLTESELISNDKELLMQQTLAFIVNSVSNITVFMFLPFPYAYVAIFCLPWLTINIATLTMTWLLHLEIIEIKEK